MLSPRTEAILKTIIEQYISKATPVPSQNIISDNFNLQVSSATIRNEMVNLEKEGYISRPHPSAGSVPSDKGYRHYVESIGDIQLPLAERVLVSHLFHQIEQELDELLLLATTITARLAQNVAVVTTPRPKACRFNYLELVSLQDSLGLVVLILTGAKVRQQLITFDLVVSQQQLTAAANKLNIVYFGLTGTQILAKEISLSAIEQKLADCVVELMKVEDDQGREEYHLDGLHLMLNQPEFINSQRLLALMELAEQRNLVRNIMPPEMGSEKMQSVQVVIGKENKTEAIHDYSVVISRYGLPEEAMGTISVIGPTRMPYARSMATVSYLAAVLSWLIARLYGKEIPLQPNQNPAG